MAQYHQTLIQQVLSLGASHAALLPVSQLPFDPSFRDLCRSNACGMYGACWMCPPYIGSSEELIEQAKAFEWALVYQTISPLEDSFDIEGMLAAGQQQNQLARNIRFLLLENGCSSFLQLGAGGCRKCSICAKKTDSPCRFPDEAMSSLEAYCTVGLPGRMFLRLSWPMTCSTYCACLKRINSLNFSIVSVLKMTLSENFGKNMNYLFK